MRQCSSHLRDRSHELLWTRSSYALAIPLSCCHELLRACCSASRKTKRTTIWTSLLVRPLGSSSALVSNQYLGYKASRRRGIFASTSLVNVALDVNLLTSCYGLSMDS